MRTKIGMIFDLDGTLLDNINITGRIINELVDSYGNELTKDKSHQIKNTFIENAAKKGCISIRSKHITIKFILNVAGELNITWYKRLKLLKNIDQLYNNIIIKAPLFDSTGATFNILRDKYEITLGIITTSRHKHVRKQLAQKMSYLDRFEGNIITGKDVKHAKPSPEGIMRFSRKWKIPPDHLVVIGDMNVDIEAGKRAGAATIGVLSGFTNRTNMKKYEPDFIVNDITEIPGIIEDVIGFIETRSRLPAEVVA